MKAKHLFSAIMLIGASILSGAAPVPAAAQAFVFEVNSTLDAVDALPGDGVCAAASGECTLRAAIMEANAAPDNSSLTIILAPGEYRLTIPGAGEDNSATGDLDLNLSGYIDIKNPDVVSESGPFAVVDGGRLDRVFHVRRGQVSLIGVSVQNGQVQDPEEGGGILNESTLFVILGRIENNHTGAFGYGGGISNRMHLFPGYVTIQGNSSYLGGGLFNHHDAMLVDMSIVGNVVRGEGGGIFNYKSGVMTTENVTVQGNSTTGGYGGGGVFNKGNLAMTDSAVTSNVAGWSGGGIANTAVLALDGTDVSQNTSRGLGGGIYNGGSLTIKGGSVNGNVASFGGGGIENYIGATLNLSGALVSTNAVGDEIVHGPGGGGIENGGTASLTNVTLEDNTAGYGGGISNSPAGANGYGGDLELRQCTIRSNDVTDTGGGIDNYFGRLSIDGSVIEGNTSVAVGAGLSNWGGNLAINSSKVQGNTALDNVIDNLGGGLFNYYGQLGVRFSSVSGNSADYGGGLYNAGGSIDFLFSLMAGNTATSSGGAVYNTSADPGAGPGVLSSKLYAARTESIRQAPSGTPKFPDELNFGKQFGGMPTADTAVSFIELGVSTLSGNGAPVSGGAIYTSGVMWIIEDTLDANSSGQGNDLYVDVGGTAAVGSSIMGSPGRKACAGGGSITSYGFNLEFGDTCGLAKAGDRTNTDPLLSPLADNGGPTLTQALALGSPAIDEGSNVWCGAYEGNLPTDQRGQPRTMDGRGDGGAVCDIGAFEAQGPTRSFGDVSESHWAYGYVEAVYEDDYVAGCSADPRLYCPDVGMNRAEGSVFVLRGVHGGGYEPSEPTASFFVDVPLGVWFTKWVQQLWVDGFTAGCSVGPSGDRQFCPYWPHTRAEATVFFLRMLHGPAYEPPEPTTQVYSDVPIGPSAPWYSRWVNAAYEAGITYQCEDVRLRQGGMFHPDAELLRSEGACMMVFAKGLGW